MRRVEVLTPDSLLAKFVAECNDADLDRSQALRVLMRAVVNGSVRLHLIAEHTQPGDKPDGKHKK